MGVGGQRHTLAALPPRMTRCLMAYTERTLTYFAFVFYKLKIKKLQM
jgi:hypothetical protein